MTRRFRPLMQAGFTLVEAVIVIVIIGILGAVVAVFIQLPVKSYSDARARADLTDSGDLALRRMARDIRLALPNSVRVTSGANGAQYLELLLTKSGGRYLSIDDPDTGVAGASVLDFVNSAQTTFSIVGAAPVGTQAITTSDSIVVYNLGPGLTPADAYATGGNRAQVSAVNVVNGLTRITLANNPFARAEPMASPTNRFQVVSSPVTYYCSPNGAGGTGSITRYWNYTITLAQPTPPADGSSSLLTNKVSACTFSYAALANLNTGLVGLNITLTDPAPSDAGNVTLVHQIHVDNTP
ncbi:MAG: prepilin-type N-terminal cleavage/methylation domain-containing protein [Pseudomonadota bacterium]